MKTEISRSLIGVALIASLHISACSSDNSDDEQTEPGLSTVIWSACDSSETLECASLTVPVDYALPEAESLELALIRHAAPVSQRKGAILFNPGGPGSSGVEAIKDLLNFPLPSKILDQFDLIGFDPRGVGGSQAIDCSEFNEDDIDNYMTSAADIAELEQQLSEYSAACFDKYGDFLLHLGSNNVVRDMDRIREALGEQELRFVGYSYGSRLASLYAQMFPARVGALVLDGSMPPDGGLLKLSRDVLVQLERNLTALADSCATEENPCDPEALMAGFVDRVEFLIQNDRIEELELFGELVVFSVLEPEVGEITIDTLRSYIESGDPTELVSFLEEFEAFFGSDILEIFNDINDESPALEMAVLCADDPVRPDVQEISSLLEPFNQISDLFAELYVAYAATCMGWPAAVNPQQAITPVLDAPVLIIGGTGDAQTPLNWSEEMSQAIAGPLIVSDHPGHTVVFQGVNNCVDQLVADFLVDDILPNSTICEVD